MFSFGIFKSNWKRNWIIPALVTAIIFLGITLPIIDKVDEISKEQYYLTAEDEEDIKWQSASIERRLYNVINVILVFVLPIVLSVNLFGYMNEEKQSSFIHGLPVSRKRIYSTNILTAIAMYVVPYVLNCILLLIMTLGDLGKYLTSSDILSWLGFNVVYNTLFFGFATFVGMMCASKKAHVILTYGIMYAPIVMYNLLQYLLIKMLFGYNDVRNTFLQYWPFTRIFTSFSNYNFSEDIKVMVGYVIVSIILALVGYLLYKIRNLEHTREMIAFKWLRYIAKYLITFCVNTVAFIYFYSLLNKDIVYSIVASLIVSAIAYLVVEMIFRKTLKVFKSIKDFVWYGIAVVILIVALDNDFFGYETRVPKIDDIESVSLTGLSKTVEVNDIDDIEKIVEIHRDCINMRNDTSYYYGTQFVIDYTLKNGSKINRKYRVKDNEQSTFLKSLLEDIDTNSKVAL